MQRNILKFKDSYKGAQCVIIGNGSSLTAQILEKIQDLGVYTFVSNGFCLILDQISFRPDALCMSNYDAIKKFSQGYSDDTIKFLKAGWRQHVGCKLENVYELPFDCEHDKGTHMGPFIKDGNFTLDPSNQNYCGDTVLLDFAVPLAFYMGFHDMFLIGVDCDYSKGYFTSKYPVNAEKNFKGMVNNDYSIAIPSFRHVNDFLIQHGRGICKLAENDKLNFIKTCSFSQIRKVT